MKIVFLATTRRDLEWFRYYYEKAFPEGARRARKEYKRALESLKSNPQIGHRTEDRDYRALPVLRTPFSFVYRVANGRIEIVRVRDGRAGE